MASNVAKGARYKAKTKKWLEAKGYAVAQMEKVHWIHTPKGRIATKRDQFGADLLAMNRNGIAFVQVKFGSPDQPKTVRTFREFPFTVAPCVKVCLIVWKLRAREPQIFDVTSQVLAP